MSDLLKLGPLLRHVDETSATVWVETAAAATVTVTAGAHSGRARTFAANGHHYALVEVDGLTPGSRTAYEVTVDDPATYVTARRWPLTGCESCTGCSCRRLSTTSRACSHPA